MKKILSATILSSLFSIGEYASTFDTVECSFAKTDIDSNVMTTSSQHKIIAGLSGGFGHSGKFNTPHDVAFCKFKDDINGESVDFNSNCSTITTKTDSNQMSSCPSNSVIVGFTGGYGHSFRHNTGHELKCCQLTNSLKTSNSFTLHTEFDDNAMTQCPSGFAMTGVVGGYGHSGNFNEAHVIECSEITK